MCVCRCAVYVSVLCVCAAVLCVCWVPLASCVQGRGEVEKKAHFVSRNESEYGRGSRNSEVGKVGKPAASRVGILEAW